MSLHLSKLLQNIDCAMDRFDLENLSCDTDDHNIAVRCIIGASLLGHLEYENVLYNIDPKCHHWLGKLDKFTEDDLVYCETVLIAKVIDYMKKLEIIEVNIVR
jgi:N-dimethylarginine dimethylaminohydrolase